jgi:mannose-6-phosphate isomerase-like protein (cupin superfamily)
MAKVNLAEKLALFSEHWSPKIVGEVLLRPLRTHTHTPLTLEPMVVANATQVDNFDVKVAKLKGEFVWHHHEHEDELFLIIKVQHSDCSSL